MTAGRLAIVVLNWNGRDDTIACIRSLLDHGPADQIVVMVDNGSSDGSVLAVRELSDKVAIVEMGSNTGFSKGNNAGIKLALRLGADVIGLLNNDTVVTPGFSEALTDAIKSSQRPIAVSPRILYRSEPKKEWFVGSRYEPSAGHGVHADDDRSRVNPFYLTGCALFASAEVWNVVGLLDARFFLNFEDLEWSRRAVSCGVELLVVEQSVVFHGVSESINRIGGLSTYLYARNGLLLSHSPLRPKAVAAWPFAWQSVLKPHVRAVRRKNPSAGRSLFFAIIGLCHGWFGRPTGPPSARLQRLANRELTR